MKLVSDLSSVKIWDNYIDDDFLLGLDEESDLYDWQYDNVANTQSYPNRKKGTHKFFGSTIYRKSKESVPLSKNISGLYEFIEQNLIKDSYSVELIQLNGQFIGQDGSVHIDYSNDNNIDYTLMVFINHRWQKEWGGNFQLYDDYNGNIIKDIEYVPGRIIFFNGLIPHKGLAPKVPNVFRKSLVYRLIKI